MYNREHQGYVRVKVMEWGGEGEGVGGGVGVGDLI